MIHLRWEWKLCLLVLLLRSRDLLLCSLLLLLLLRREGRLGELELVGDLEGELGELAAAVVDVLAVKAEGGGRLAHVVA